MMKPNTHVIVNATNPLITALADTMRSPKNDTTTEERILAIAPIAGTCTTYAPTAKGKHKGYHRIKCEILIPEDAITGNQLLNDLQIVTLLSLPKDRVHGLPDNENDKE